MDDGDRGGSTTTIHSDTRFIVATTLATLVVAGSTYIWRSNPRRILGYSHQPGESVHKNYGHTGIADSHSMGGEASKLGEVSVADVAGGVTLAVDDDINLADGKDPKFPRSKERRRRGKDPLKELLKGGKKSKVLTRSIKLAEVDGSGVESNTLPAIQKSTRSRHSRERSLTTSSRSVSTASTSNHRTSTPTSDWAQAEPSPSSIHSVHENDDANTGVFSTPNASNSFPMSSQNQTVPESHPSDQSLQPDPLTHPQSPDCPNLCLSTSSSTSHSSSIFSSDLGITPNTSPTLSLSDKTPTLQAENPPSPPTPANAITTSTTLPSIQNDPDPWAWDTVPSSSTSESTMRKPPRFRSKSRGSGPSSISPTTSASNMLATSDSEPTSLPSFGSAGPHVTSSHLLTFPTLNSSSGPLSNSNNRAAHHVTSNGNGPSISSNANGHPNGANPKRAPTPRCPPTPLAGTNTPPGSLSTQTQLASLRGALEAARLREEKTKAEIERYSKDLEMMRWESATWRRREMELQNQIHHLMHQVQSYATMVTSMSAQPSPSAQHHRSNNNTNGAESHSPQNGYQFTPPGPHSPPPHLQIPQMFLANGITNPLSPMGHLPHSPFYTYSPHSPHTHQHVHSHIPVPPNQSPRQQSSMTSMLFPQVTSVSGSEPSSIAGSSTGSHSPDLAGSPSPTLHDRGRRRTRTRTQTAGVRISEHTREENGDGWIGVGDDDAADVFCEREDSDDDDDEEGSVSEVLADAILKRPGSIRGLSSKKGKGKEKEPFVEHTEFTYPSLSDFGNVIRGYSRPVEVQPSKGEKDEDVKGINEVAETMIETTQLVSDETRRSPMMTHTET